MKEKVNLNLMLQYYLEDIIRDLEHVDSIIDKYNLQNEQIVLNFYDKLNEISVRK